MHTAYIYSRHIKYTNMNVAGASSHDLGHHGRHTALSTPCFIDNTNDYELHDTTLADGANLYQLDSIQRCLSETEFSDLIHDFGVASANVLNPTHMLGCGDNGAEIDRAFDSRASDVFVRQEIYKLQDKLTPSSRPG